MSAFYQVPRRYDVSNADLDRALAEYDCAAALEAAKARRTPFLFTPVRHNGLVAAVSLFGLSLFGLS